MSEIKEEIIEFASGDLKLEGVLERPLDEPAGTGVVICHPHPLYGGDMNNNVVVAVSKALVEKGIYALRFNFRGVGKSTGKQGDGTGEKEDALAAVSFLSKYEDIDGNRLGLVGYSFGGAIALDAGMEEQKVKAMAAISPAGLPQFSESSKPRLVVSGGQDMLVPASTIAEYEEKIVGNGEGSVQLIKEADHFWWGYENKAAGLIVSFLEKHL